MVGRTDRSGQDLGVEGVIVEDHPQISDQLHAVNAEIIEPADEGRDIGRAGLGGEQALIGGKAQRHIGLDILGSQRLAGFEAFKGQRQLDHDIIGQQGQLLAFREVTGDFGTLLYAGKDWEDKTLGIRSMELMAEKVMPAVNAAIGQSEAAE